MKKYAFLLASLCLSILSSCGVGAAEDIADEFHEKLDAGEYSYIIDNMIDADALVTTGKEEWLNLFNQIELMWGKVVSRDKDFGFKTNTNNGVTRVQLDYTVNFPSSVVYERIFLVDHGNGTKIQGLFMNESKSALDEQAGNLN